MVSYVRWMLNFGIVGGIVKLAIEQAGYGFVNDYLVVRNSTFALISLIQPVWIKILPLSLQEKRYNFILNTQYCHSIQGAYL
jgi:hypothetical protein